MFLEKKNKINENISTKNIKTPLFKIFMNENKSNVKKLHLIKAHDSRDDPGQKRKQCEGDNIFKNNILDFQIFSYKILEAKHNSTPELYAKKKMNALIRKKKNHFLVYFNEMGINTSIFREFLKRMYKYSEVKERIPKYVTYYKNYLTFFCRPIFTSYIINKKMVKHMERIAQIFYNENYADEEDKKHSEDKDQNDKNYMQIFSSKIKEEIENCNVNTYVSNENTGKQIEINDNNMYNKIDNKDNSNKNQVKELTIIENNYKITPILYKEDIKSELSRTKKNSQTTDSMRILIDELENKKINMVKIENYPMDKLKDKEDEIINKINDKYIVIHEGKTTNNINININHLTIGQKVLTPNESNNKVVNGLSDLNKNLNCESNKKLIKKLNYKTNNNVNNPMFLKGKTKNQVIKNYIFSLPQKNETNITNREKNSILTLPLFSQNVLSTSNKNKVKKYIQIFPKPLSNYKDNIIDYSRQLKESRNRGVFRSGLFSGSTTNINKYTIHNKNNTFGQKQFSKITINTKNSNYFQSMLSVIKYGTTKMKNCNKIIYNPNEGKEGKCKSRSISHMNKRNKRIFNSTINFSERNNLPSNSKNSMGNSKNSEKDFTSQFSKKKIGKEKNNVPPPKELYIKINNRGIKLKDSKMKENYSNLHKILNMASVSTKRKNHK